MRRRSLKSITQEDLQNILKTNKGYFAYFKKLIRTIYYKLCQYDADLSYSLFENVDFTGLDISFVDFKYSKFKNCVIGGCNVSFTNFLGACFYDCTIMTCYRAGIANWNNSVFKRCSVDTMSFHGNKNMKRLFFKTTSIINSRFDFTDMSDTTLSRVNIRNSDFRCANLSGVIMKKETCVNIANFSNSDLTGVKRDVSINLENINVINAKLNTDFFGSLSKDTPRFGVIIQDLFREDARKAIPKKPKMEIAL